MSSDWEWDNFNKQVEQEAKVILEQRKDIEQEALRVFRYFESDVKDTTRAKLTAERLVNASVFASQQGDEVRAVASLRVAIEIDNTYWKAYYNIGWHYLTIGKRLHKPFMGRITIVDGQTYRKSLERLTFYRNAIHCLEKALNINPNQAKGWCLLGQAQYYMQDYDKARITLNKAIELDPQGEGGKLAQESLEMLENRLKEL